CELPARARLQPDLRGHARALPARGRRRAGTAAARLRGAPAGRTRPDRTGAAGDGRGGPLGRLLGGAGALGVTSRTILHLQKVAGISGSEAHLLSLLPDLRERGWDIRMVMLHEHEAGAWEFARELEARGVPLDAIPLRRDVDPIGFCRLAAYLARHRPALLHTHLVHADVYGQLAAAVARVPARFSTKHGFNEFREWRTFGYADRAVARLADVHIAISRGLAQYLAEVEGFDETDFEIVHYGIDPSPEEPAPYEGDTPRLLCIGRLIPIKGHVVLLRAFAAARAKLPELRLDVAGRGPLEPALKALAKELDLGDAVRFLGHVSPVQAAIEQAQGVVVPSLGE